jgi:uncharacterized protein YndB with AHSA1/START domain
MENKEHIAKADIVIQATPEQVWKGLTESASVEKYMMGAKVESDWKEGSPITWKGQYKGKTYEDKGKVLKLQPGRLLRYSHYSPMSGKLDDQENYHTVNIELHPKDGGTAVSLTQDNNASDEERRGSEKNWKGMLDGLRKVVEG